MTRYTVFNQEVESGSCSVSASITVVEQQALGSTVWAALASLQEDLEQAAADIPIRVDCPSVLGRYSGYMVRFREEACLFCNALQSLELHR